jgi:hypothetical protein
MPTKGVKKNNLGELHVAWEEEEGDTPPTSADSDEESHGESLHQRCRADRKTRTRCRVKPTSRR